MKQDEFQFFTSPGRISQELKDLKTKSAFFWKKKGERKILSLFKYVYENVPAYKKFLRDNKIKNIAVRTLKDFSVLPITTKANYLRSYNYIDLFPRNRFFNSTTYSATSGSTGEPFFFPRGIEHDAEYEYMAELFLKDQFEIDKKSTLGIMGFALGIWIGGVFTFKNFSKIAEKGYSFSIIPVGTDKERFLTSIKKFGHLYDQILLMGYPPFIKDVLDSGPENGISWGDYNIKILTAAEGFSENFRMYIARKAKLKNPLADIINLYGTVELGTMAHETAFANAIRNIASKDKKIFKRIFPDASNIPTLAQFYPHIVWFEGVDGEVIASGYGSSIPLLRYKFNDLGGVIDFDDMMVRLKECGIDIFKEMKSMHIKKDILHLPFVYLYARSDFSVSLYGIIIYPEYLRDMVHEFITGRFTIRTNYDKKQDQFLELNVELQKGVRESKKLNKEIQESALNLLLKYSTEYHHLYNSSLAYRERLLPRIVLWPYGNHIYFSRRGKQLWVQK